MSGRESMHQGAWPAMGYSPRATADTASALPEPVNNQKRSTSITCDQHNPIECAKSALIHNRAEAMGLND